MSDETVEPTAARQLNEIRAVIARLKAADLKLGMAHRRAEVDMGRVLASLSAEPTRPLPELLAVRAAELGPVVLMAADRVFSPAGGSWLLGLTVKSEAVTAAAELAEVLAGVSSVNYLVAQLAKVLAQVEAQRRAKYGVVAVGGA